MRRLLSTVILCAATAASVFAHDLFFRPDAFFVEPGGAVTVKVLSGTFSTSENAIMRDRLSDLSLVTPAGRTALERTAWTERDPQSTLPVKMEAAGTYLLGASLQPRMLTLAGPAFNAYLKEEGLDHILAARRTQKRLGEGSRERYSKYVKALLQVGDATTDGYSAPLGYAAELIPLANPYTLKVGDTLSVRCVVDGKPVPGQVLFAGGRSPKGTRLPVRGLVADGDGVIQVKLTGAGAWYVKAVHMREVQEAEANYESLWSTLSFGVR